MSSPSRNPVTVLFAFGTSISVSLWLSAPTVISWILGPQYGSAVPVLRILALLLPLVALSNGLGTSVLVPLGYERRFAQIVVAASILNIVLALILGRAAGPKGVAWAAVAAHALLAAATVAAALEVSANTADRPVTTRAVTDTPGRISV